MRWIISGGWDGVLTWAPERSPSDEVVISGSADNLAACISLRTCAANPDLPVETLFSAETRDSSEIAHCGTMTYGV